MGWTQHGSLESCPWVCWGRSMSMTHRSSSNHHTTSLWPCMYVCMSVCERTCDQYSLHHPSKLILLWLLHTCREEVDVAGIRLLSHELNVKFDLKHVTITRLDRFVCQHDFARCSSFPEFKLCNLRLTIYVLASQSERASVCVGHHPPTCDSGHQAIIAVP